MKAARIHQFGGPEVVVYEDAPVPEPKDGQVLVRIKATTVNRFDVAIREHRFPVPRELPLILGTDGAGIVECVGPGVTTVDAGEHIMFTGLGVGMEGSHADFAVVAETQAVTKPVAITFEQAAALGQVFPTADYALQRRAKLQQGETVLVQGAAGGVGSAAVQLAAASGARVLATVSSEDHAQRVRELGADETINRNTANVSSEIRRITDGRGVDVILEIAAADNLAADVRSLAKGGRIVVVGAGTAATAEIPLGAAGGLDATILFMNLANAGRKGVSTIMRAIATLVESGAVKPVIDRVLPLSDARRGHELLEGPHFGKIVLVP